MKTMLKIVVCLVMIPVFFSCGDSEKKEKDEIRIGDYSTQEPVKENVAQTSSADMVDFSNKGVGPVKSVSLNEQIDEALAVKGAAVFDNMCTACHKIEKKYIGPAVKGVTERRSPEWIMNMILNPEEMLSKDPIAKQLMVESNMAIMADQNIKEEEARALLEYFRTLDQ